MRRVGTGTMVEEQIPILSRANLKKSTGKIIFFGYLTNELHSFNCFLLEYEYSVIKYISTSGQ